MNETLTEKNLNHILYSFKDKVFLLTKGKKTGKVELTVEIDLSQGSICAANTKECLKENCTLIK